MGIDALLSRRHMAQGAACLAISLCAAFLVGRATMATPCEADIAAVCLLFHWAGSWHREKAFEGGWGLILLSGAASLILASASPKPDLYHGQIGTPLLFHATALAGIMFWTTLARRLPVSRLLSRIGACSIVYLALHQWLVYSATARILSKLLPDITGVPAALLRSSLMVGIALIVLVPLSVWLDRKAPALVGHREPWSPP